VALGLKIKKSAGVPVTLTAHRLIAKGNTARDRKDWTAACAAYRSALGEDAGLAHIWVQLGHAAKELGAQGEAQDAYLNAARLEPANGDPLLHLGHLSKLAGDISAAREYYRRAAHVDPGNKDTVDQYRRLETVVAARQQGLKRGEHLRDTDADWRSIGEDEPYYGVLTDSKFRRANLTPEAIEAFYASGVGDVHFIVDRIRGKWPDFAPSLAVDFGCGVGRLVFPMRAYAATVVGVDVAPAMLEVAQARATDIGVDGVAFTDVAPEGSDWINSYIVFQHIPPKRGLRLIETLVDGLAPGGFLSLQLTLYRHANQLRELPADAAFVTYDGERSRIVLEAAALDDGMRMFDYDANAVLARLFEAGMWDLEIVRTDHGGYIGAWFFGRKPH
jgi:predicted TPR repeat methyltransferase